MTQVSEAADRVLSAARQWGVKDDHPEGQFFRSMADLLSAFEAKLEDTRDLPMDKIESTIRKAASTGLADAAKSFRRSQDWRAWALAGAVGAGALVAVGAMGFVAGYGLAGRSAAVAAADLRPVFQTGLGGAEWLAQAVKNNDLSQLASVCKANTYKVGGADACRVSLWVGRGVP